MVYSLSEFNGFIPLGVFSANDAIFLFLTSQKTQGSELHILKSKDGIHFDSFVPSPKLVDEKQKSIDLSTCKELTVSSVNGTHIMLFKHRIQGQDLVVSATSKDLKQWQALGMISPIQEKGVLVNNYQRNGNYVLYYGEGTVSIAYSKDLLTWQRDVSPVLEPYKDFFGTWPLLVGNAYVADSGIHLLYYIQRKSNNTTHYTLSHALFDKQNPQRILEAFSEPIWEPTEEFADKTMHPVGCVLLGNDVLSYWNVAKEGLVAIIHPNALQRKEKPLRFPTVLLRKIKENPIIRPLLDSVWESKATFNPTAVFERGKVHIVYRAIGDQDVSVLGYATSTDGIYIDERYKEPIYTPKEDFELSSPHAYTLPSPSPYTSGGGCYGGCEDPRITKIDDTFYMTYVAYDGWRPPRVALTSIQADDFFNKRFAWEKPVLISKPGVVDKNACILPERINGKYVIFHRIFPDILIDFVDDLNFDGQTFLEGEFRISPQKNAWDSRKVGVGPTPLKTPWGWLLIYHAVGDVDSSRYKMGAMLLDLKDPTRVLYRSRYPILEPTEWYENEGYKSGVAYPCGAVSIKDTLFVYYGGADTVVCVATAPLQTFIEQLQLSDSPTLTPLGANYLTHYHD